MSSSLRVLYLFLVFGTFLGPLPAAAQFGLDNVPGTGNGTDAAEDIYGLGTVDLDEVLGKPVMFDHFEPKPERELFPGSGNFHPAKDLPPVANGGSELYPDGNCYGALRAIEQFFVERQGGTARRVPAHREHLEDTYMANLLLAKAEGRGLGTMLVEDTDRSAARWFEILASQWHRTQDWTTHWSGDGFEVEGVLKRGIEQNGVAIISVSLGQDGKHALLVFGGATADGVFSDGSRRDVDVYFVADPNLNYAGVAPDQWPALFLVIDPRTHAAFFDAGGTYLQRYFPDRAEPISLRAELPYSSTDHRFRADPLVPPANQWNSTERLRNRVFYDGGGSGAAIP